MTSLTLLPKVRSSALTDACAAMPCTLRLAGFLGLPCAHQSTVVACHLPTIGKGVSTKVSDLFCAAGCATCHDLIDGRDPRGFDIAERYPAAFHQQMMRAGHETQSRWLAMGLIHVEGMEVI